MSEDKELSNKSCDNRIELGGPHKYATHDLTKYYEVSEGLVYVYVFAVNNNKAGRSILIYEATPGRKIPSLFTWDKLSSSGYFFFLDSNDAAVVYEKPYKNNQDKLVIEEEFLDRVFSYEIIWDADNSLRFTERIINLYNDKLETQERIIGAMEEDQVKSELAKRQLISSVFNPNMHWEYGSDTESLLYNTVSVYCDYMNIYISPYRVVKDTYGNDFTINDIARCSHFVVRKVVLDKDWYKKSTSVFLAFSKEDNKPLLCVPSGNGYRLYDIEKEIDIKVEVEEAEKLQDEVYVIYQHLPSKALSLKELLLYSVKQVHIRDMVMYGLMYLIVILFGLLLPWFNEKIFDTLIPVGNKEPIYQLGLVILTCMIGNIFFRMVQSVASFRMVKSIEYRIMSATIDRIFKLPQKFIESFGTAELINRAVSVSQVFTSTVTSGVSAIVGFLLGMIYLWRMFKGSDVLSWRGIILSIISAVFMMTIGYIRVSRERNNLVYTTEANGKLYSYISGILKIKTSGLENRSLYEFQKSNIKATKAHMLSARIQYISNIFTTVMSTVSSIIIYYTVIRRERDFTLGNYTAFSSAYGLFQSSVGTLVSFFVTAAALVPVIGRIRPIFEQEAEIADEPTPVGRLNGNIEVNHLDFAYEDDDNLVLKDINFKIKKGEFVGIVGQSGCGKSTLLRCLLGFETPKKGNIFYDDIDLTAIDKCELRRQLGVVLQDGKMLAGNIYSNVTLSNPDMEVSDVMKLLKEVGLYADVEAMPMGVFTSISEGGGSVSGGQQQRILLARAIANNPAILFLDEATSALDNITQSEVCGNLAKRNITRIMIAHRLSTVQNCDRILVMDKGRIVEEGSYNELMDKKGYFYNLAKRQQA